MVELYLALWLPPLLAQHSWWEMSSPNKLRPPLAPSCVTCRCQRAGRAEAQPRGDGGGRAGPGAEEKDPAGPPRHPVDHRLQCAQAHEAAVRCAPLLSCLLRLLLMHDTSGDVLSFQGCHTLTAQWPGMLLRDPQSNQALRHVSMRC